jgi:hypothetical protein
MHNEAIEIALKTWYPENHSLRLNPHHPLGKLLGEWGELLDDYMKSIYKPGYEFEPENELGDIWYYLRILCYQYNYTPSDIRIYQHDLSTDMLIGSIMECLAAQFCRLEVGVASNFNTDRLEDCYATLKEIARRYNLTLDDLTASNWEKLKPGSERGDQWRKAKTKYG